MNLIYTLAKNHHNQNIMLVFEILVKFVDPNQFHGF